MNAKGEPRGGVAKPAAAAKAPSQPKPVIRKPVVSLVWVFLFLVTMVKVVDAKRMKVYLINSLVWFEKFLALKEFRAEFHSHLIQLKFKPKCFQQNYAHFRLSYQKIMYISDSVIRNVIRRIYS